MADGWPRRCPFDGEELFSDGDAREHFADRCGLPAALQAARQRQAREEAARETVGEQVPRGVLVRERMMTRCRVDPMVALRSASPETEVRRIVDERIVAELRHYCAQFGYEVHDESIYLTRVEDYDPTGCLTFEGEWCPDPEKGCEIRGGPHDGVVQAYPRTASGYPPRYVAVFPAGGWPVHEMDGGPVQLSSVAQYERVGIDSMRDRWVYEFRR